MKIKRKFLILSLRIVVSAILISSIFIITFIYWNIGFPNSFELHTFYAILITAFFIKTDSLSKSIWSGVSVGILSGLFFSIFSFFVLGIGSGGLGWGVIYFISSNITVIWIISCLMSAAISYFIRERIKKIERG